jgi:putative hydrolase
MGLPMRFNHIFRGNYMFHLHTTFTDGKLSVRDYFEYAASHAVDQLIFLEHIRREPSYDVDAFIDEVRENSRTFRIAGVIGFEAKLLPDGELDITKRHLSLIEVLGIAEHSFPDNLQMLQSAFKKAVDTYSLVRADLPVVWVHPGLWFKRRGLLPSLETEYASLAAYAAVRGLFLERNRRYGLAPEAILRQIQSDFVVDGLDAHSWDHLQPSGFNELHLEPTGLSLER